MTLTETAIITKRSLLTIVILMVLGLASFFGYQYYYYYYYLPSQPVVEEQPELKFGLLPKLEFQEVSVSSSNFTYTIDTKTGNVPEDLPKLIKVYFIPLQGTTLLAPDRARDLAKGLKFNIGPDLISATKYRFTNNEKGELLIDLNSGNFNYQMEVATASASPDLPDQTQIASNFKKYLTNLGLLKDQLVNGRIKVSDDRTFISLWQENIDDIQIVTPSFKEGLIRATVGKSFDETQKFPSLDYTYWQIDKNNSSTYPLKNAKTALDELKSGLGNIVVEPKKGQISITDIYLAYYLPEKYTRYLQPIFVFQGDNFVAYVSAIANEQIENEATAK